MNAKLISKIIVYAKKILEHNLCGNVATNISVRENANTMYITKTGVDFANLTGEDIFVMDFSKSDSFPTHTLKEALLHKSIYEKREDIACIMVTSPIASLTVAGVNATVPPVLDDMAQIVGPTAKTAKTNDATSIVSALKGRGACLLNGIGSLSTGRTLDEAFTACLVLDKACYTFIMSAAVGGSKPVSKLSSIIEHKVYQKKYSKINQAALLEAERK
ncbi:MAG: class II aldolase/adducin family protein [Clostridia bacterium]